MNVTEAIRARRSIRKYQAGAVIPREHLRLMLEAAMMAPSACNTRPWEFVVAQSDGMKQQLASLHPYARHLTGASAGIVVCARPDCQEGIARGFFPQDCGAAIENLLLQAVELGYGGCWCGIYPHMARVEAFAQALGVQSRPLALVTLGVPAEAPKARGFYDESRVTFL